MSQPKSCGILEFHFSPMLKMKKAQGLPITTIVIAAISLIVLFVLIVFFTGGFSKIFGQAKSATEIVEADRVAAQTKCTTWCTQAQGMSDPKTSSFCKDASMDIDGDGRKGGWETSAGGGNDCKTPGPGLTGNYNCKGVQEKGLSCLDPQISASCSGVSCQ